ncbi:MAG: hypothetical protein N3G19_03145 [Candidatus Pacearchaeota archaeon]|nr:hypothetical protein [Candidatus Pacearchaeota archaeon]
MKTNFVIAAMILVLITLAIFVSGCGAVSIEALNEEPEKYMGKELTVSGTVEDTVKIGALSGFRLRESEHTIAVSSKTLSEEGKRITVKGTLMKDDRLSYLC